MASNQPNECADPSTQSVIASFAAMTLEDQNKLNKELKPELKDIISKKITLNDAEAKENVAIMESTVKALVKAMKEKDPLFAELYQKIVYTGSYYDGVCVKDSTEFDLNLVIRLPFDASHINMTQAEDAKAFMHVALTKSIEEILAYDEKWTPTLYQRLKDFFQPIEGKNHLMRNKFQCWIQSVISKAIPKFQKPKDVKTISRSQSGPALTWIITTKKGIQIDVDLVPVIDSSNLLDDGTDMPFPPGFHKTDRFKALNKEARIFYLVPKPVKGAAANSDQAANHWMVSFPEAEKKLISGMSSAKPLIKLFKLLRDSQNWKKIASYYIKTMFLREIDDYPSSSDWAEDDLGTLFMKMLEKFKNIILDRHLSYYFSKDANLLSSLETRQAKNIADRLDVIIKLITKDPKTVWNYMGCNEEEQQRADKLNKELKPELKDIICKKITLNDAEAKENVAIMESTVIALVKAMREEDPLFNELYQKIVYTGSYYDGVRVKESTEFDLNLVIRLPFDAEHIKMTQAQDAKAFMHVELTKSIEEILAYDNKWTRTLYQRLKKFFKPIDGKNYLMRNKIQRWIQSVISKAIPRFQKPEDVETITPSQSGPAFTWIITTKKGIQIDVDLVPVIDGSNLLDDGTDMPFPPGFHKTDRFETLCKEARIFYLVPKPAKGAAANSDQAANYWRVSFPEAEKKLISGMSSAKPLIKLFKLLRDSQNWKNIASYYIKTMFLHEIDDYPFPSDWEEGDLGTLFMKMLVKFKEIIIDKQISYYFSKDANLLSSLKPTEAKNISDRLEVIIKSITKDPKTVCNYIGGNEDKSKPMYSFTVIVTEL